MEPKEVPLSESGLVNSNPTGDQSESGIAEQAKTGVDPYHQNSDVDSSQVAMHHRLGISQNQASPGSHIHDGVDSRLIPGLAGIETDLAALDAAYQGHDHGFFNPTNIPDITNINRAGWVPTWTASVANPAIGNGTMVGDWLHFGRLIFLTLWWKKESATNVGNGFYSFTLPFPLSGVGSLNILNGMLYNNAKRYPIAGVLEGGKIDRIVVADDKAGGTPLLGNAGWASAWANGDYFYLNGWYWDA